MYGMLSANQTPKCMAPLQENLEKAKQINRVNTNQCLIHWWYRNWETDQEL